jgi:hypothetical protein
MGKINTYDGTGDRYHVPVSPSGRRRWYRRNLQAAKLHNMPRPKNETYIIDLCDELLGLKAIRGHTFDALRGDPGKDGRRRFLPLDAFYPTLNLVIEYDERQHTETVAFFDKKNTISGIPRGEQRKKYDLIKRAYPAANQMHLVVFSFRDFKHTSAKRLCRVAADRDVIRRKLLPFLEENRT